MLVAQSCLTLFNPLDYSPPGSSVHGISEARILEWVNIPFSRDLPIPEIKPVLQHSRWILYRLNYQGSPENAKNCPKWAIRIKAVCYAILWSKQRASFSKLNSFNEHSKTTTKDTLALESFPLSNRTLSQKVMALCHWTLCCRIMGHGTREWACPRSQVCAWERLLGEGSYLCVGRTLSVSHSKVSARLLRLHFPQTEGGPSQKVREVLKQGGQFSRAGCFTGYQVGGLFQLFGGKGKDFQELGHRLPLAF